MGKQSFSEWVAWKLPHNIVMWAYVRVVAHGTTGRWSNTLVPDVTAMEILKRWDDPNTLLPGTYTMKVSAPKPKKEG